MTPERAMGPDPDPDRDRGPDEVSDDELRAERDELLEQLAGLRADDPQAPRAWAVAGDFSYQLFLRQARPEDLDLADEAFERAFARPGEEEIWDAWRILRARVLLFRYDDRPQPELLDQAWALLVDGLAEPVAGSSFEHLRVLGRYLVARLARLRWVQSDDRPAAQRAALLAETLRRYDAALDDHEPGSPEAAELHGEAGALHHERYRTGGDLPDAQASVRHFRAALEAATPDSDVPLLRYGLATAQLAHGQRARDRELLTEARTQFGRALVEAGERSAERPWWGREAMARMVYIRAMLWWHWDDSTQVGPAEAELAPLLAEPGAVDELLPTYLDCFGRLLYQRATERDDDAGRDRALHLLQRALDRWQPEHDGGSAAPLALLVATLQWARYRADGDPARLPVLAAASGRALEDESQSAEFRRMAVMCHGWVRHELVSRGLAEAGPEVDALLQEAHRATMGTLADVEHGGAFVNLSDQEFNGLANDIGGLDRLSAEFDRLYRTWREMDPDSRESGETAAFLYGLVPFLDPHGTHVTTEQKTALLQAALQHRKGDAAGLSNVHAVAGLIGLNEATAGDGSGLDGALEHIDAARDLRTGQDGRMTDGIELLRSAVQGQRGQLRGGLDEVETAASAIARLRDRPGTTPYLRSLIDGQVAGIEAIRCARQGDLAGSDRAIARLAEVHGALDPDDPARGELWTMLENARMGRDQLARSLGLPTTPMATHGGATLDELRRQAARLPRDHRAWVLGDAGIARTARAMDRPDPRLLDEGTTLLREALELSDEGSDDWLRYASVLGSVHCAKASRSRDRRELETGIDLLERAARLAGGPEHRLWAVCNLTLGRAYRLRADPARDDRRRGRLAGLESLRGHSWAALLQSGTGHAAEGAAEATAAALEVAAWCLADDAPEAAVQALDACRGLVLHAANTAMTVPELLTATGRPDLAEEWRAAGGAEPPGGADGWTGPGGVPSELRRRVLTALTAPGPDGGPSARLLGTPAPAEIGEALRSCRADALVYLVPASDDRGGAAVLVTADGGAHWLPLPLLKEDAGPLRAYTPAGRSVRDMGPAPHAAAPDSTSLRRQLDRLCSWAWYAAVKPLLDLLVPPPGRTRPPSLILVPMGALGVVPWHAAWSEPDATGRRRYAVEQAEISYAASARLLCDVAARPSTPHTGAALVVGNPTGDLRYAGEEADAVQRAFYPRGSFLGRRAAGEADGPGTPAEVLAWLRRGGGGVLHLACHATVAANQRYSSYLSFSGGELAAEELTEAAGRSGDGLELVVLAACRSHVSGRGHNEAYSLATAFLVAGARSVIGSLWPVPDDATSVLMFMTHHFLRREQEQAGRALRRAQLWMLDPDRRLPPGMPGALAARAAAVEPDDLSAWAGFTHLGQ
ncbi:CHAT domain-containing protein [Kitasatospora sp. NPDC098652]|uniref:CHAT domain-containing protein n=1 Tax=Kitasatospora sp. NPDC098652 TaxID=3364095 RepID=UPI0037F5C2E7